jgi:ubiquinone/menaquinone biosynthesis C-methylase UbiE
VDAEIYTDRQALTREKGYGTTTPVLTRASIYRWLEEPRDLVATVLAHVELDGAAVLDVGCGPGLYLRAVERDSARLLVGLDLSIGMVDATRQAVAAARVVNGDVQALPFPAAVFDVALAPHMLYHVPDIPAAVGELRRVLRDRGTLLAVANGAAHLAEMRAEVMAALADVTGDPAKEFRFFTDRFSMENGADLLGAAFTVETVPFRNRLVVPEAEPVVSYVDTMPNMYAYNFFAGAPWPDVLARFEQRVRERIERDGAWVTTTESCVFVCRR